MDTFTALAEPTRRHIIEMLAARGQLSASQIGIKFRISRPAISQHLKVLREAKLVSVEKQAQKRLYQLDPKGIEEVQAWVKHMTQRWHDRFDVLDDLLRVEKAKLLQIQAAPKRKKG